MRSKVRQFFLIAGMLVLILSTLGVTTSSAIEDNIWDLTITATGQDPNSFQVINEQVINESDVIIGLVNEDPYSIDAPPASPIEKYTVCLKILGDGGNLYMVDIRQIGSDREEWILSLEIGPDADPNFPGYYPVLSWEPYDIGAGTLELWRGDTADGCRLVSDMSDADTYQSQGDDASGEAPVGRILTYTLVFLPVNPPEISSTPPLSAKVGIEYLYEPTLAADPADSWSLEDPPTDMSIDPNTGRITWIPNESQIGDHEVTLTAVNRGGSDSQTWTISAGPSIFSIPPGSAKAGEEYTYSPEVLGEGDISWSLEDPPTDMSIDLNTGRITWIPDEEQVQTHTVTLMVTVNDKEDSQTWTITVEAGSSEPLDDSSGGGGGCFLSLF